MMAHSNQWAFVIAAYALTALGTFGLLLHSWMRMRGAEARAEGSRNDSARRDAGHSISARGAIAPDQPGKE